MYSRLNNERHQHMSMSLNEEKKFIYSQVNFDSFDDFEKYSKIIILIENGYLSKDQLTLLNQYNKIYASKISGWYRIDRI